MIKAFVGSGGKTTLIKEMAAQYRAQGKTVFVATTTHMFIEDDTLLTDHPETILRALKETGYAMAGIPEGGKIKALPQETFHAVCDFADVVLVEADGSSHMPIKYPNATEPVIPDATDEIVVVCGLHALGHPAKEVCHRLTLVKDCLGIDDDTIITPSHVQTLVKKGYLDPLRDKYPDKKIFLAPRHDGSLYQRALASLLQAEADVSIIHEAWFCPQPKLIICGGGHVASKVAALASFLDFRVCVIDERANFANREHFPTAEEVYCDSYENLQTYLEPGAYYVVATPNHQTDQLCVRTILGTPHTYLGMIGSQKKVSTTFEHLRADGFSEAQIRTIHAPIGLPIGAITPAEIAVSILSQIIQIKNRSRVTFASKDLLEVQGPGTLCIITQKHGSTPRDTGSMMFVDKDRVIGSIGGSLAEYQAICHARETTACLTRQYEFTHQDTSAPNPFHNGWIQVLFIPI